MEILVVSPSQPLRQMWLLAIENLGEDWRCRAFPSVEAALPQVPPGGVHALILLGAAWPSPRLPPAAPYVLGTGAPDGPIAAPEELPLLLAAWREDGRLPALALPHLPAAEKMSLALLRRMDAPQRLRAWELLPRAIALTVLQPAYLDDVQHGLYRLVGAQYGLTAGAVERRVRLWIEATWNRGDIAALEQFFGTSVDPERGKPTNREFLAGCQGWVTRALARVQGR